MSKQEVKINQYNAWRNSLPEHCWHCFNFDRCSPNHSCPWNPKTQKQEEAR